MLADNSCNPPRRSLRPLSHVSPLKNRPHGFSLNDRRSVPQHVLVPVPSTGHHDQHLYLCPDCFYGFIPFGTKLPAPLSQIYSQLHKPAWSADLGEHVPDYTKRLLPTRKLEGICIRKPWHFKLESFPVTLWDVHRRLSAVQEIVHRRVGARIYT